MQKLAHKIGDAYDFKHDAAIVYANSLYHCHFTNNANYVPLQIADDVYESEMIKKQEFLKKCRRKSISRPSRNFSCCIRWTGFYDTVAAVD